MLTEVMRSARRTARSWWSPCLEDGPNEGQEPVNRLIAPDLPSFGFTTVPDTASYAYTFLTETIKGFVDALALRRYAIYVFDYGAFNLAVAEPDRVTGVVSQNGNAYEEGLGEQAWASLRANWKEPSAAIRDRSENAWR